jgi:glycine C-acetyltransferase
MREGLNFATQDYLSLASHPDVHAAAADALRRYGVHSGGSSALQGVRTSRACWSARSVRRCQGARRALLVGVGRGVRARDGARPPDDHIIMDRLAHASLQTGRRGGHRNISASST